MKVSQSFSHEYPKDADGICSADLVLERRRQFGARLSSRQVVSHIDGEIRLQQDANFFLAFRLSSRSRRSKAGPLISVTS